MKKKFIKNPHSVNYILKGDGFFVSFNAAPCADMGFFGSDDGGPETALVVDGKYLILNGDFRKEYEAAIEDGVNACKAVYYAHNHTHKSSWTTGDEEVDA